MGNPVDYAYTQLNTATALTLTIDGVSYDLVGFSATFNMNSVPEATCVLSIGRNARDVTTIAAINTNATSLTTMQKAKVTGMISGDFTPSGDAQWPTQPVTLFEGYYVGFAYQKQQGKVQFVVHLLHWLVSLGFSSCLSALSHQSNNPLMAMPAVLAQFAGAGVAGGSGTSTTPAFLQSAMGGPSLATALQNDIWNALRDFLCHLASFNGWNPACGSSSLTATSITSGTCGGSGSAEALTPNNLAQIALGRIEGAAGGTCDVPGATALTYTYGQPLQSTLPSNGFAVLSQTILGKMQSNISFMTMWEVLVGMLCPMFGLDLCPAIDRAVILPSVPGWRGIGGKYWKTIAADEYNSIDESGSLSRPLRGVVVTSPLSDTTGTYANQSPIGGTCAAGIFAVTAQQAGDGVILYASMPEWLMNISWYANLGGLSSGLASSSATGSEGANASVGSETSPTGGNPAPQGTTPPDQLAAIAQTASCWARLIYIQNMLRGRNAVVTGKLRFDIAPGSHVKLEGSPEKFIGAQDGLAASRYGQVNRVTINIDAENRVAFTALQIIDTRNDAENADDRTSIAAHPFFPGPVGKYGGLPLLPELDLDNYNPNDGNTSDDPTTQ
jgi:hypothetical protein